jgi:sugar-specific transcriptional regulator TrmB
MSDPLDIEKNQIIQGLQNLGFTLNDSKVYFTLLVLGRSNPAKISETSGVDRARVYDSLKRLTKRKVVEEEPVKRAPQYKALPPNIVFDNLRTRYSQKINLTKDLEFKLESYKTPIKQPSVWSVQGTAVEKAIGKLIEEAKERISIILTPDIYGVENRFRNFIEFLIDRKQKRPNIEIELAFNVDESQILQIRRMYNEDIAIYRWESGAILPFGLYLSESSFILTILVGVQGLPEYDFGITMENATKEMIAGFNHLIKWSYANQCKRAIFEKKSKSVGKKPIESEIKSKVISQIHVKNDSSSNDGKRDLNDSNDLDDEFENDNLENEDDIQEHINDFDDDKS